jgi:carotenoid cleavage dioxygenase-like enzyme
MSFIETTARTPYALGFDSLTHEVTNQNLPVDGTLPEWLTGVLLRNGPATFEAATAGYRHWFDGQAMLHRFAVGGGRVCYTNRALDTPNARAVRHDGRIGFMEFATDPCQAGFARIAARYTGKFKVAANPNVNITKVGGRFLALTETPLPVEFDPETLQTLGVTGYDDDVSGHLTTAHPHRDPASGDLINYVTRISRKSEYRVYRLRGPNLKRELVGSVPVSRPAYMHTFGICDGYMVLAEFPFVVSPLEMLLRGVPLIENYRWRPDRGTRFIVMDLRDGSVRGTYHAPAFFAFHHINAFVDGDDLVVDACAYDDARIIDALYLDKLRAGRNVVPTPIPTRYRIDLDRGDVTVRRLTDETLELPRIAYDARNGRDYRFVYGVGVRNRLGTDFANQLVKADVTTGGTRLWTADGCYPGEPVFVAAPGGAAEDDGVLLSVVLDSRRRTSYLLVLDARTFAEVARAEVPHPIPFGFHGQFHPESNQEQ